MKRSSKKKAPKKERKKVSQKKKSERLDGNGKIVDWDWEFINQA